MVYVVVYDAYVSIIFKQTKYEYQQLRPTGTSKVIWYGEGRDPM